ncbi:MAG TPA: hypothetical protein VIT91_02430 [Chthoniobacterales bacterium]
MLAAAEILGRELAELWLCVVNVTDLLILEEGIGPPSRARRGNFWRTVYSRQAGIVGYPSAVKEICGIQLHLLRNGHNADDLERILNKESERGDDSVIAEYCDALEHEKLPRPPAIPRHQGFPHRIRDLRDFIKRTNSAKLAGTTTTSRSK